MKKYVAVFLFVIFLVAGCASTQTTQTGKDFDASKVKQIVLGKTTSAEVIKLFGKPYSQTVIAKDQERWEYSYSKKYEKDFVDKSVTKTSETDKKLTINFNKGIAMSFSSDDESQPERVNIK